MKHSEYIALLRTAAELHVDIQHSNDDMHFARIILTKDPYLGGVAQIQEFMNSKGSKLKYPCLLAVSYDGEYKDNRSDSKKKMLDGAFIILNERRDGKNDEEEQAIDQTETIGEEILGYLHNQFEETSTVFDFNNVQSEKIAKVGNNLSGTKFYFTIEVLANSLLEFNPAKFS